MSSDENDTYANLNKRAEQLVREQIELGDEEHVNFRIVSFFEKNMDFFQ